MRRRTHLAVAVAAALLLARPAGAYILPAESICLMLAEARARNGVRDVTLQLNADQGGRDHQVDERLYLKRPERLRLLRQEEVAQVRIDRDGQMAQLEGSTLKVGPLPSDNLLPILWMPRGNTAEEQGERICSSLRAAGIDLSVVALARAATGVAYVIGARAFEPQRPQLWVDRTSLQPLRIILPRGTSSWLPTAAPATAPEPAATAVAAPPAAAAPPTLVGASTPAGVDDGYPSDGDAATGPLPTPKETSPSAAAPLPIDPERYELRLSGYGEGPGGNSLPKLFEEYQGNTLLRRAEVTQVRFNQNLAETLFEWSPRRRR